MDIKSNNNDDTEYILPCAFEILSEDDIFIEFVISVSISMVIYSFTYV